MMRCPSSWNVERNVFITINGSSRCKKYAIMMCRSSGEYVFFSEMVFVEKKVPTSSWGHFMGFFDSNVNKRIVTS